MQLWGLLVWGLWGLLAPLVIANPDAKRLYDDLLSNYNRLIRPVSNNTDTVLVKLGLRLSQLIDLVSRPHSVRPRTAPDPPPPSLYHIIRLFVVQSFN